MDYKKTVYVKDYDVNLNSVSSEKNDDHSNEFRIYNIEAIERWFTKHRISKWHPEAEYIDDGLFKIENTKFFVKEIGYASDLNTENNLLFETKYENYKCEKGLKLNNLKLFQRFKYSFFVDKLKKVFDEFNSDHLDYINICSNDEYNVVFGLKKHDNMVIKYNISNDFSYEYVGTAYGSMEIYYDWHKNIDFDEKIEELKKQKQYSENAQIDAESFFELVEKY